jgi:hypothetical protein
MMPQLEILRLLARLIVNAAFTKFVFIAFVVRAAGSIRNREFVVYQAAALSTHNGNY